jgi:hypothetical protein
MDQTGVPRMPLLVVIGFLATFFTLVGLLLTVVVLVLIVG